MPKSWHTSNGTFKTHDRGKLRIKFLDYSASREYNIQPDIVEYDTTHISKPGFDLILGCKTIKELGVVRTKEITLDEISLPMRDIKNLRTRAAANKARTANNSIYQSPESHRACLRTQNAS